MSYNSFQATLDRLLSLHDQEVSSLRSEVLELRHHLKKLQADSEANPVQLGVEGILSRPPTTPAPFWDSRGPTREQTRASEQWTPKDSDSGGNRCDLHSGESNNEPPPANEEQFKMTSSGKQEQAARIQAELRTSLSPAAQRAQKGFEKKKSREELLPSKWSLRWCVEHPVFDWVCAFMIIMNSALVGANVEWAASNELENMWYTNLLHFCSAFFFVELCMRLVAFGCKAFFLGPGRGWNTFDAVLVFSSVVDLAFSTYIEAAGGQVAPIRASMRTIKIMRIARLFRVFRFFKELSLLTLMIIDSMKSLGWAIVLVMIVVYVFAILFTDNATENIRLIGSDDNDPNFPILPEMKRVFGSLSSTTYTLIQATLGGVSWGVLTDILLRYDTTMAFLFFFYLAFTMLAVLNIITGVFVDNAVETAQTQREFLVQREMELKEKYVGEMKNLFLEMDGDGDGTITMEEIHEYLQDIRMMSYFQALGLDPSDAERLFRLIDDDGSGGISVDEFLAGCLRLKGGARSIDIHALIHDLKKMFAKFERMENFIADVRNSQPLDGNGRFRDAGGDAPPGL